MCKSCSGCKHFVTEQRNEKKFLVNRNFCKELEDRIMINCTWDMGWLECLEISEPEEFYCAYWEEKEKV